MHENEWLGRMQRLERNNRYWRTVAIVMLLAFIALMLAGFKAADFAQPDLLRARSIEAQSFVLRDADGQVWARMGVAEDGARLTFYDEHGKVVSSLPLRAEMRPAR